MRHNRAAHFSDKQYKCKNTSGRKAHREWKSRIAWKQHKEDILFIHCKPCVVLSELGVDGLGGELNKSVQLNKSVSVLPFRGPLHAEPCHDWHYKKKKKDRRRSEGSAKERESFALHRNWKTQKLGERVNRLLRFRLPARDESPVSVQETEASIWLGEIDLFNYLVVKIAVQYVFVSSPVRW